MYSVAAANDEIDTCGKGLVEFDHDRLLMGGEGSDGLLQGKVGYGALVGDVVAVPIECCPNTSLPLRKLWLIGMPLPDTGLSWNRKLGAPAKNGEFAITSTAIDDA